MDDASRAKLILELGQDRALAHAVLFSRRHTDETPAFHLEIVRDWHSAHPRILTMAYRGGAKSTLAEEALIIMACYKEVRNVIIIGENETRGADRLRAIKHEFENNEFLQALFDIGPGPIWGETRIELSNGVILQAFGRGQSLRGVKHLTERPDMLFGDDLEDEESVRSPMTRQKVRDWFSKTALNIGAPGMRVRLAATPLDPEALAPTLAKDPSWRTRVYPVEYKSPTGERVAIWPARNPLEWIDAKRKEMEQLGDAEGFQQEYMCQAVDPSTRVFTADMFKIVPQDRSWHAVYAMVDPARTTHKSSATTGIVTWSWIGRRLVIWSSTAKRSMPDEIISDIFKLDETYVPVLIGVEETGLNEFLLQPLRQEQTRRGHTLPLRPLHAPRGKLDFIRALQPYFKAGEVEFAADMPELRAQLLSFPTGDIDAPNALAYALKLRAGAPIYDGFARDHIAEVLKSAHRRQHWLVVNATGGLTTAVLCQIDAGSLAIFNDWLVEGDPGTALYDILIEARLAIEGTPIPGASLKVISPQHHWASYDTVGLRAACGRVPITLRKGGLEASGREELRGLLSTFAHGLPRLQVSVNARWTLRAFAGGYCRRLTSDQPTLVEAEPGPYRVLMEGLESFAALLRVQDDAMDQRPNLAYTADGRAYVSALPR